MPYNLLILPLCGGYYIISNFVYFKYRYQRLPSQRILFNSIIAAFLLLIGTFLIRTILQWGYPPLEKNIFKFLESNVAFNHIDYLWTSIASLFIALTLTELLNLSIYYYNGKSFKAPISYAVRKFGDEIEKLFRTSVKTGQLMQITLKNNKVYIGFTDIIPVPKETNYLKITPVLSGYRESETKMLRITTEYYKVIENFTSENPDADLDNIDIIIKQDEILSSGFYDQRLFDLFNKKENGEQENQLELF